MCACGWPGLSPFCVFFGGVSLFLPLSSLGWCTHCLATVWLTWLLLVLWVAAGRAPAALVVWVMYTHVLVACPVGFGSGSPGWAVAPAGFVRSWVRGVWLSLVPPALRCRFGGGRPNFLVVVCAGGPPPAGGGGVVLTGVWWLLSSA